MGLWKYISLLCGYCHTYNCAGNKSRPLLLPNTLGFCLSEYMYVKIEHHCKCPISPFLPHCFLIRIPCFDCETQALLYIKVDEGYHAPACTAWRHLRAKLGQRVGCRAGEAPPLCLCAIRQHSVCVPCLALPCLALSVCRSLSPINSWARLKLYLKSSDGQIDNNNNKWVDVGGVQMTASLNVSI